MHHDNTCLIDSGKFTVNIVFGRLHLFHFHIKQLWIVAIIIKNDAVEKNNILVVLTVSLKVVSRSYKEQVMALYINVDLYNQGLHYRGCRGMEYPPSSASQQIVISLCQQLSLDWLMITPEQIEMDNILNIWQKEYFYSFICKS